MTLIIKSSFNTYSNYCLLIVGLLIAFHSYTQELKPDQQGPISLSFGGNYTRINYQNSRQAGLFRPFVGINGDIKISKHLDMQGACSFSFKASQINPSNRIKQNSIDLVITPLYHLDDFWFKAGLVIENSLSTAISSESNIPLIFAQEDISTFQINYLFGVEFKLNDHFNFFIHETVPREIKDNNSNTIVGLKYRISSSHPIRPPSYRKLKKESAKKHIEELRKGVLLVRLKTADPSIEALKKNGDFKKAEQLKLRQEYINRNLVDAFKRKYTFSEVQFFYSNSSADVKKGNLEGIFLDQRLQLDSSIKIAKDKKIFTVELATIEQDSLQQYSHESLTFVGSQKEKERFYGSPNLGLRGLVIKTRDFKQLSRPFPFYTRYVVESLNKSPEMLLMGPHFLFFLYTPNIESCVQKLNAKLERFYQAR